MRENTSLRFNYLYQQYITKKCTTDELTEFFNCVKEPEYQALLTSLSREHLESLDIPDNLPEVDWDFTYQHIITAAKNNQDSNSLVPHKKFFTLWTTRIAAAILLAIVGLAYFYIFNKSSNSTTVAETQTVSTPNYNKAILTSSTGQIIELDNNNTGQLLHEGNTIVSNSENSELSYYEAINNIDKNKPLVVNHTLTTPPGAQYQLTLEDGTRVWLNTSSTITYPTHFIGRERIVILSGEAYFEVVHNKNQPFKVMVGDRIIEDLGTRFNVNAYSDESTQTTTLLEGAVKVSGQLLKPGEKATVAQNGNVTISKGNIKQSIAWKNGMFDFTNADLSTVMREIARWYNLKITYEGTIPQRYFTGMIERSLTLDQMLKGLAHEGVNYRLENERNLVIIP